MKRFFIGILALVVISAMGMFYIAYETKYLMQSPIGVPATGMTFEIRSGSSFDTVNEHLVDAGIIAGEPWLRLYARWKGVGGQIKAGEYQLLPEMTTQSMLQLFLDGDVQLYSFTLVEGWNQWEVLAALRKHEAITSTLQRDSWGEFLAELESEYDHPEGLFLPETYRFPRGTTDRKVLSQAYDLMQEVLAEEWDRRAENILLESAYEALILASIIEKETAHVDERATIAGVFARRLEERMRLQMDPTVIYGIGPDFNGNLTRRDLRTDTPYNTYTRHGLPPTPIAMPGRDAIRAALNPADGDTLYFVATGLGDGRHNFSATKEEHDKAVAEYLVRLRSQR